MTRAVASTPELSRIMNAALMVAAGGGVLCLIASRLDAEHFLSAYLVAFSYWLSLSLGCIAVAMIHGMTGGGWGNMVRRGMEAGSETVPLMALLFLPIGIGMSWIYRWTDPAFVASHEVLERKSGYLNPGGFWGRAVVYFVIWIVLVTVLNRAISSANRTGDLARAARLQRISGFGFMVYGFSFSLASVDWMMSLEPLWYSTMYPLIQIAGHGTASLSLLILVSYGLERDNRSWAIDSADRLNDYGNLMLASVMFWAYCSFFQYLIIWNGNLPEEIVWYVRRQDHGWQYLALALVLFHFAIPFSLLLSKAIKRDPRRLCLIAALLLLMHYVDLYWTIEPAFEVRSGMNSLGIKSVFPLLTWVTFGAAWVFLFLWRLTRFQPERAVIRK